MPGPKPGHWRPPLPSAGERACVDVEQDLNDFARALHCPSFCCCLVPWRIERFRQS
jgi:hypothetical protein